MQIGPDTPDGVPIVPIKFIRKIASSALPRSAAQIEGKYSGSRIQPGDILLSVKGSIGEVGVVPHSFYGNIAREIARIRPRAGVDAHFLALQLEADHTQRRMLDKIVGSTRREFSIHAVRKFVVALPPVTEQLKIAAILRTWEEAIDAASRLIDATHRKAAALSVRAFEGALAAYNQTAPAYKLFQPIAERNRPDLPLLAVMQDIGIVRRDALDRRVVMPEGDVSSYKVVRPGDFVISLRSFEGGLEFSEVEGLVSPAYTVLRTAQAVEKSYYRHFFKSRSFIGRLDRLIFGIRDGKQIAFRDFGEMKIPFPPRDEQAGVAAMLDEQEQEIALLIRRRDALQRQKRGLMQKLLTGEWRVSPEAVS